MKDTYIKELKTSIDDLQKKKKIAEGLLKLNVYLKYITIYGSSVNFVITKENTTKEAVNNILTKYKLVREPIHGSKDDVPPSFLHIAFSDVLGYYIYIRTTKGTFIFQFDDPPFDTMLTNFDVRTEWKNSTNTQVGKWGLVRYQKGSFSIYPREKYQIKTIMKYLNLVII